jgi:hypothetical protein
VVAECSLALLSVDSRDLSLSADLSALLSTGVLATSSSEVSAKVVPRSCRPDELRAVGRGVDGRVAGKDDPCVKSNLACVGVAACP